MATWTIVFIVVAVLIVAVWIGNTIWWTRRNNTLGRKSPRRFGRGGDRRT
jgi:hypothetical protein